MNTELVARLRQRLWEEREALSRSEWLLIRGGRYAYALGRDLFDGELSMRAMSLVYTTLLSIVPLLALGFSVLKALGAHNSLEPVLLEFLRPLGPQSVEISGKVIAFVEKIQVGVLGSVGVALLFYTAISLIQKVESSFNFIWRIERSRPLAQRIGEYLGVLMVGPVLVFSALGLTASILSSRFIATIALYEPFGGLIVLLTKLIPYAIIVGLFCFMYAYLPNTRVKMRPALVGGLAAGVLWQTSSLIFASFVANASNYNAIYSSFALIIFLLIWIYVGWLILLTGCQLAFYVQNPRLMETPRDPEHLAGRDSEYLALLVMALTGRRFLQGLQGLTEDEVVQQIEAPPEHVTRTIETLVRSGYLTEAGTAPVRLIPARDPGSVKLTDLWRVVRTGTSPVRARGALSREVAGLIDTAETQFVQAAGDLSLRDWLASLKG